MDINLATSEVGAAASSSQEWEDPITEAQRLADHAEAGVGATMDLLHPWVYIIRILP